MIIRPFVEADYEVLPAIIADAFDEVVTAESLREEDRNRDPKCRYLCLVAEAEGQVVACSNYAQYLGNYHPQKFQLMIAVRKAYRGRGIGTALYDALRAALAEFDPISLESGSREDWADGLRFLARRGFVETMTFWESQLDLDAWEPAAVSGVVDAALSAGYRFVSWADLEAAGEPDFLRRIHAMVQEVKFDVPSPEPHRVIPYEEWLPLVQRKHLRKDLYYVAMHGDEMVGLSTIFNSDEPGMLQTGLTAVKRAHRRQGVARALKVVALQQAKAAGGASRVKTSNESNNRGMLGINEWLGFVRKPGWVAHRLELRAEA